MSRSDRRASLALTGSLAVLNGSRASEADDRVYRGSALRHAADLIDSVVQLLDTSGETCTECGALRRLAWLEYQTAVAIRHMPSKLRDYAVKLDM